MLPAIDLTFLETKNLGQVVSLEAGMVCILLPNFPLPAGFNVSQADLLLRLSPGYPDVPPDMWWFSPAVYRANGSRIEATESVEHHLGRKWQRWSRHLDPKCWMAGVDSLESYFALIASELRRAARIAA